jgi:hypothetical protein
LKDWISRQMCGGHLFWRDVEAFDQRVPGELRDGAEVMGAADGVRIDPAPFVQMTV